MKSHLTLRAAILSLFTVLTASMLFAQRSNDIQFYRFYDQRGVNVFEAPKVDDKPFEGLQVRIGGAFAQQFQALSHSNNANPKVGANYTQDLNKLYPISNGFNLATANLNLDVQLDDGIRVALENYMSARHHNEFWVKGGYIQIDKLPMFNNTDWFDKYLRVKIGHFQPNYGDQQFRRTDNGNAIWNPFVGNYIMDAFATEIGSEVYAFLPGGLTVMGGLTAGLIKGDIDVPAEPLKKSPSIYLKAAYDKQVNDDVRFRLSASLLNNSNTVRNTIYSGDRTGSRFYLVMEPEYSLSGGVPARNSATNKFTSGRFSPGLNNNITAIQINPFVKFKGLELFGAFEVASGKNVKGGQWETDKRTVTQVAAEAVYRFLPREQMYIGAKYNQISGDLTVIDDERTIDRIELTAGWYTTKNLLLKVGYVNQNYNNFSKDDLFSEGNFKGAMIEAIIGF